MRVTPLHSQWLPTRDACAVLGVTRRTLQRRAAAGAIDTRAASDGRTLYAVPATGATGATPATGATGDAPSPATRHPATGATHPATHPAIAALAGELAAALERGVRAELERDAARARVAQLEAACADLAARLVKRGRLLRELAARSAP